MEGRGLQAQEQWWHIQGTSPPTLPTTHLAEKGKNTKKLVSNFMLWAECQSFWAKIPWLMFKIALLCQILIIALWYGIYMELVIQCTPKLEKLHLRALRIITNDYECSYVDLLCKTNTSTIYVSRLRKLALFVFKALNNECKPVWNDFYELSQHNYQTRSVRTIKCPHVNSVKYGTNSIQNQGALLWNSLAFVMKTQCDFEAFKESIAS